MILITEHGQSIRGCYCTVEDDSKEWFKLTVYEDSEEQAIKVAKKFIRTLTKKRKQ